MSKNHERNIPAAAKWLQGMICLGIASLVNSLVNVIPIMPDSATTWVSRGIMAGMIFCTYKLSDTNPHYQKSAAYRAVMLGCTLAAVYLFKSSVLNFAASIFSLMAVYQEYSGHAELVKERDPKLAGKWRGLFYWGFVAGTLVSLGSVIAALLIIGMEMELQDATPWIIAVVGIPQLLVEIVYLRYLRKTIPIVQGCEVECVDL